MSDIDNDKSVAEVASLIKKAIDMGDYVKFLGPKYTVHEVQSIDNIDLNNLNLRRNLSNDEILNILDCNKNNILVFLIRTDEGWRVLNGYEKYITFSLTLSVDELSAYYKMKESQNV